MKKYNLSNIMKRAWELVKKAGATISEGLKKAWAEAKTPSKDQLIEKLIEMGANRWTKFGKDRLYFNSREFMENSGFEYDSYKTGSIRSAYINGERISSSEATRILTSLDFMWLNIDTMKIESRISINDNALNFINNAMAF